MTASTAIKLSPAMVTALKGAEILGSTGPALTSDVKQSTVSALASRGLVSLDRYLTPEGVEAARQLGNDTTTYNEPAPIAERVQEVTTDQTLSESQESALESLGLLLDTPQVVPNREDKRKARFSLRGAYSRMVERKRARKVAKYGQTNYKGEALSV